MHMPAFTATASLPHGRNSYFAKANKHFVLNNERILPQQWQCGNQFLNSVCPLFLPWAYGACWYACAWNANSTVCKACVITHVPFCAPCLGV